MRVFNLLNAMGTCAIIKVTGEAIVIAEPTSRALLEPMVRERHSLSRVTHQSRLLQVAHA